MFVVLQIECESESVMSTVGNCSNTGTSQDDNGTDVEPDSENDNDYCDVIIVQHNDFAFTSPQSSAVIFLSVLKLY